MQNDQEAPRSAPEAPRRAKGVLVTVRVSRELREAFTFVCVRTGQNPSELIREFMRKTIQDAAQAALLAQVRASRHD